MHGRKRPFFERDKTTLDKIVAIVERTEETTQSQSSKLEFLEETLRETKERINQSHATIAAVDTNDGSGTIDRAQISALLRDELGRIEEKIEQVKSISCSLIEEVSESNKNELLMILIFIPYILTNEADPLLWSGVRQVEKELCIFFTHYIHHIN